MQFSTLISVALSFATVVLGQQANGQNSFTYPLGGTLDASVPLLLKWTPTTSGTITIKLLKGPTTNILDVGVVAASIANTGSYTWSIPSSLQDSSTMPSGDKYGLKILDDATNTYEYSPPFDIAVPDSTYGSSGSGSGSGSGSSSKSVSTSAAATQAATPISSTPTVESTIATGVVAAVETAATASTEPTTLQTVIVDPTATTATGVVMEATAVAETTLATQTYATAPNPTSAANSNNNTTVEANNSPDIVLIIGIAAGGIVFVGLAIFALVMVCRCKNRRKGKSTSPVQNAMSQRPKSLAMGSAMMSGNGMYNRV